jgi:hypothetical protein
MEIAIKAKKDYWGAWVAKSRVPLQGDQFLELSTSKSSSGKLVSRASVVVVEKEQGYEIVKFAPFSDYNKCIKVSDAKRVTEKVVIQQQQAALAIIEDIKADALAFYA